MSNTTSPNMGLIIPGIGTESGPTWASDINADLASIDSHDHSPGKGVPITPSGLNINSDLAFQSNNATQLRSARFTPQVSVLSLPADIGCLYVVGNELYYNDVSGGHNVQITANGSVNATSSGISSGSASASFAAGVLVVKSSSTSGGNVLMQSAVLTNSGNLSNQLTLQAPSISGSVVETLPTIPGSTSFVTMDNAGSMGTSIPIAGGLTGSNISSNVNLSGKSVQESGSNVVVSSSNATNSLAVIRGIVSGSFTVISGEGFTVSNPGGVTGQFLLTWTNAFSDTPSITVTPGGIGFFSLCVTADPTTTNANVFIMNTSNSGTNQKFSFVVVGQRA